MLSTQCLLLKLSRTHIQQSHSIHAIMFRSDEGGVMMGEKINKYIVSPCKTMNGLFFGIHTYMHSFIVQ